MKDLSTAVFPVPRSIRRLDGPGPAGDPDVVESRDPDLPGQGYRLTIRDTIRLSYADAAGRRYGRDTLGQLRRAYPDRLPAVEVVDRPAFTTRGFMLDVSRGRVPTRDTLRRLVDVLETARYNQFQLYLEHTFAYAGHEAVWRDASPFTPADIAWLDALCRDRGIELVPNQNVFGHMENWLSAGPEYRMRAELPDGNHRDGAVDPPTTLAPTVENAGFVGELLAELLPNFSSRSVNIGCDETFELGRGVSAEAAWSVGVGRLYVDFIRQVWTPLLERGYEVQLWGDIVASHPELVPEIPSGVVPIAWWYERPYPDPGASPWGAEGLAQLYRGPEEHALLSDGFAARTGPFRSAGRRYWVAPGTGVWASLLGRTTNAYPNLANAAQFADDECDGYLVTHWGDRGAWEHPSVILGPLVYGGAVSWNPSDEPSKRLPDLLSRHVFAEPAGRIAAALELMGGLWERLGVPTYNCSPVFGALADADTEAWPRKPSTGAVAAAQVILAECDDLLAGATPGCDDGDLVVDELRSSLALASFGLDHILSPGADAAARGDRLRALLTEHVRCWLARARPGGLDRSLASIAAMSTLYGVHPLAVPRDPQPSS